MKDTTRETCATCRFHDIPALYSRKGNTEEPRAWGYCRRHAPTKWEVKSPYERLGKWVFRRTKSSGVSSSSRRQGWWITSHVRGRVSTLVFGSTLAPRSDPQRFSPGVGSPDEHRLQAVPGGGTLLPPSRIPNGTKSALISSKSPCRRILPAS